MPDELAVIIAQEVAKQLPAKEAYNDALSPAAKEVGGLLADVISCLRLALLPVQIGAAYQKRLRSFIDRAAQRVPEERRELPPTQILGPVLEGIRYEPEGSMSDEAFSRLLSAAFDRERVSQAHPAFPQILRSLADDEITLLRLLRTRNYFIVRGWRGMGASRQADLTEQAVHFHELKAPQQYIIYANHLEALGLISDLHAVPGPVINPYTAPAQQMRWILALSDFGELLVRVIDHDENA